jgi:hypothetical protein
VRGVRPGPPGHPDCHGQREEITTIYIDYYTILYIKIKNRKNDILSKKHLYRPGGVKMGRGGVHSLRR